MDIQITKKNGDFFTFEEYGIIVKDFIVSSIPLNSVYGEIEGRHGTVDYGAIYGTRTITVPFVLRAHDLMDYPLLRDVLFDLVLDTESFYIREMRRAKKLSYAFVDTNEPARMDETSNNQFVGGKRYLVRLQNTFDLEQIEKDGEGELVFETTELPFAESISTTKDIQENGISNDYSLWGEGMGILSNKESFKYRHNTRNFRIYNAGNIPIHPFQQDLRITITNLDATGFTLKNLTNGSEFKINEEVTSNQTIVIDGANVTSNGLAFLRATNKQFIELETGWNEFETTADATIEFDFRYYYK